jgi:hypothetical protein
VKNVRSILKLELSYTNNASNHSQLAQSLILIQNADALVRQKLSVIMPTNAGA